MFVLDLAFFVEDVMIKASFAFFLMTSLVIQ